MGMNDTAIQAALQLMNTHICALNEHDAKRLAATMHFPHHRLSGTEWKTWETAEHYFDDFLKRAGSNWNRSKFSDITVVDSSADKVHLDVEVQRYDCDDRLITSFRSLWVIVKVDSVWAAQFRSSFAYL